MSVRKPDGWTLVEDNKPAVERAKRLFTLRQNSNQNRTIAVSTEDATGNPGIYQVEPKAILEALTKDSIEKMADPLSEMQGRMITIGGQEFARSDFKSKEKKDEYWSALVSIVKGNVLKVSIASDSSESLTELVRLLMANVIFDPEWSSGEAIQPPSDDRPQKVRVSQGVSEGLILKKVSPKYPSDARRAYVQGTVVLHAVIGTDGKIKALWVLRGDPLLVTPAVNAVKQWEYRPYFLQGKPIAVETQITVNYKLAPR